MAVYVEKNAQGETLFTLETKTSTYQMKADTYGYLLHLYYGDRIGQEDTGYLLHREDRGLCACPNDLGRDRTYSLDCQPQEYHLIQEEHCLLHKEVVGQSVRIRVQHTEEKERVY